jgi:hypothetical protein
MEYLDIVCCKRVPFMMDFRLGLDISLSTSDCPDVEVSMRVFSVFRIAPKGVASSSNRFRK